MYQEKLPPHNIDAEEAVLGSCLVDPEQLPVVMEIITPEDFFREINRWVFEAMVELGEGLNQITVGDKLKEYGKLESIGGPVYLSHLVSILPTSVHAKYYADIISRLSYCRKMITAAGKIAALGYEAHGNTEEMMDKAHGIITDIEPVYSNDIINPPEHAERMFEMITRRRENTDHGLYFGYRDLDNFVGGIYPGNLVIVGGRPGTGKSNIMQEIALENANIGKHVLIASREMSLEEFDERHIQMETGIGIEKLRCGNYTPQDWDKLQALVEEVNGKPLVYLEGSFGVDNIGRKAAALKRNEGLDLIIVDYIQLLRDRNERKSGDTLRERIGYISNTLKSIATELKVPVIAASQLNRNVEGREDKRPTMSDIKESGDIEQDSDIIILLHRPEIYDPLKEPGIMNVIVAKHRQLGVTGLRKLVWRKDYHRYGDFTGSY